jgi:hypothetical protein
VTLTDKSVKLSRLSVPAGLVVFDVRNLGKHRHRFVIANNFTPDLWPNRTARLEIVFVSGGKYRFDSPGIAAGVLRIIPGSLGGSSGSIPPSGTASTPAQPCANPTVSSVAVTMTDKSLPDGYSFTPNSVPCGMVTFVLTDVGTLVHGLALMDPRGQLLPPSPTVGPSQTTSVTENLAYTGSYQWSDITSDAFGEAGLGVLIVHP